MPPAPPPDPVRSGAPYASALLADQEARARTLLTKPVFDYFDGGSGEETSRDEAGSAWRRYRFRPQVLRDVSEVTTRTELFGTALTAPIAVAPTAAHGALDQHGEVSTATGVAAAGSLLVVSTRASRRIEDIAAVGAPWWLQVYVTRDRSLTEGLVRRAARCGASALVLTADTPFIGRKARQGRLAPLADPRALVNLGEHLDPEVDPAWAAEQDPSITAATIGWLAEISGLPVLVKGVLRGDEARRCIESGAAGIVVSNHGGRQLDRAVATAAVLPEVVAAADGVPVLVDGGVRCGADAAIALALGARAVLIGRPPLWALAVDGSAGVQAMLDALRDDLAFTLALLGARDVAELDPGFVV